MTRPIRGGALKVVKVVTAAELQENGGRYVISGRLAIPVHGAQSGDRSIVGGPAIPIYIVSEAEIVAGHYRLAGGSQRPILNNANLADARSVAGNQAIPIYLVSGTLTPASDVCNNSLIFSDSCNSQYLALI